MSARPRRSAAPALLVLVVAVSVASCGSREAPSAATAGAPPSSPSTTASAPAPRSAPSTAAGLSAAEVREAVESPEPSGKARPAGPVARPVRLASGAVVWRVQIPGRFPVRSARVVVSVGGRDLGEGVPGPHLQSLVAVTRDPRGLTDGAPVAYRWPGAPVVAAGRLAVVR